MNEPTQEDVIGDDRVEPRGEQRRRYERWQQHRVGEGEGQSLGIEDVRVEQRPWVAEQLPVHPPDSPDRKERIAEIRHSVHPDKLRVEDQGAEGAQAAERDQGLPHLPRATSVQGRATKP